MGLNVLSLFDGISCGQVALERANIPVDIYYASEIDKYAVSITQYNYPNTVQLGDVTKIDFNSLKDKIDLIIGGSPCTDLSIAGKRAGLSGEHSSLFYNFVEALEVIQPKYFLLENNVGMPQDAYEEMSRLMGCYPIAINSSLVSAQNRRRYYWTNIKLKKFGLLGNKKVAIPQPTDRGIYLQDILESGYPCLIKEGGKEIVRVQDKASCLLARDYKGFNTYGMTGAVETVRVGEFGNGGQGERIYHSSGKSVCLGLGGSIKENYAIPCEEEQEVNGTVYTVEDKKITQIDGKPIEKKMNEIDLPNGDYVIRKLTPIECERLQTLPDNYTKYGKENDKVVEVSNTQRYKVIGNGWTCDVIAHIFSFIEVEDATIKSS